MTKKQKLAALFGKIAAAPALFLLMLFAVSTTAYAAEYELYIGSTQVTDANKDDILGDGTASYDPGTATLSLNGVNIGEGNSHYNDEFGDGYDYSLFADTDAVKHLVIEGDNNFASTDNGMLFKVMGPTEDDNVFANHSLMITGDGTLTSTVAGDGYEAAAMTVVGETASYMGKGKGGVFMGNTDGTGPRLELTGLRRGAYFYEVGRFQMQGGTIIAKATGTPGTGVTLPPISNIGGDTYFEGGTIAGYGTAGVDTEENEYGGAFEGTGDVGDWNTGPSSPLEMQRVYPAPEEDERFPTNYSDESGWCVVGMTQGNHVADTQAVLSELGLDSSGGGDTPGPGTSGDKTGGSDKTDSLPYNKDIDVWGFSANTVYSVDVEWGAMTFEYAATWNTETHKLEGGKWKIYDSTANEGAGAVLEDTAQHAINKITITNHSNAGVKATLSYTAEAGHADTGGTFTIKTQEDSDQPAAENVKASWDETNNCFTLQTASTDATGNPITDASTAGTPAKGNAYFMPSGISNTNATSGITKWTKIGNITVSILAAEP